jgi:hypothetical protein
MTSLKVLKGKNSKPINSDLVFKQAKEELRMMVLKNHSCKEK